MFTVNLVCVDGRRAKCQLPPSSSSLALSAQPSAAIFKQDEARRAGTICGYIIVESSANSRRRLSFVAVERLTKDITFARKICIKALKTSHQ